MLDEAAVGTVFRRLSREMPIEPGTLSHPKLSRDPFRATVACILSAQSLDANTAKAADALFSLADTPQAILALDEERLLAAIRPAGLYNMKARNIRRLCAALIEEHDGAVPTTREGLMGLPGVGRKCADIVLRFTYGQPVCPVDTHVHRVANRLGLAHGKTEAQTARALEPRIPDWARMDSHIRLIRFGRRICRAPRPRCRACFLRDLCEAYREGRVAPAA
jgi:endonuclease III